MDKRLSAEQLRRALQILTQSLPEERAMEIASVYPAWEAQTYYKAGDMISYGTNQVGDPQLYKVAQDHMSQAIYPPGKGTESLYTAFGLDDSGYPLWAQPSGAHDAYHKGDVVNYNGKLYESVLDENVWPPDVYPTGWKETGGTVEPDPEPPTYPEWVQPSGSHDAYNAGDVVSYNGVLYRSTIDGNTWAPDAYPQGWEVVE
jgi:hypothetical protein